MSLDTSLLCWLLNKRSGSRGKSAINNKMYKLVGCGHHKVRSTVSRCVGEFHLWQVMIGVMVRPALKMLVSGDRILSVTS